MPRTAIENIRRMRFAITVLVSICSALAGYYWAHVLSIGMLHVHGHAVLIGAFFFTLAALVFVIVMELLAVRAMKLSETIGAVNADVSGTASATGHGAVKLVVQTGAGREPSSRHAGVADEEADGRDPTG